MYRYINKQKLLIMAKKCFRIRGVNCSGGTFDVYDANWESISTASGGCGVVFVLDGVDRSDLGSNQSVTIEQVDCSFCGNPLGCDNPPPKYDCINGECVPKTTYNTPGQYSSLAECQASCGTGTGCAAPNICVPPDYCPPGMVCVPSAEWGQIEGLAGAVRNKNCS